MNGTPKKVIIIDDDPCSNIILKTTLKMLCKPFTPIIRDFTSPAKGLEYLEEAFVTEVEPAILFLDINMPVLNGWKVLDRLNQLPEAAQRMLTVYMFSSSLDIADKQKAIKNPLVKDYLTKPLTTALPWLKKEILGEMVLCS